LYASEAKAIESGSFFFDLTVFGIDVYENLPAILAMGFAILEIDINQRVLPVV